MFSFCCLCSVSLFPHSFVVSSGCSVCHSFSDSHLSNSLFLLNILYSIESDSVNWKLVHINEFNNNNEKKNTDDHSSKINTAAMIDEVVNSTFSVSSSSDISASSSSSSPLSSSNLLLSNACYFLSCARKLGAEIYAAPQDIVEVKKHTKIDKSTINTSSQFSDQYFKC